MNIEISSKELQKHSIMVTTPAYGGNVQSTYTKSMIDLGIICQQYGINFGVFYLSNESLITRARAYCVDHFMRSNFTHLMFIDSDIGFDAKDVIALLGLSIYNKKDYNVIGAPYAKKTISWEKISKAVKVGVPDNQLENFVGDFVLNIGKDKVEFKVDEPLEVMEIGTGFMLIPRETIERFQKGFPEYDYFPDHVRSEHFDGSRKISMAFDCEIDRGYRFVDLKNITERIAKGEKVSKKEAQELLDKEKTASKRYLSEDYLFCQNVRSLGMKVWICPWMRLSHTGTFIFGGSLLDILAIGASPTS